MSSRNYVPSHFAIYSTPFLALSAWFHIFSHNFASQKERTHTPQRSAGYCENLFFKVQKFSTRRYGNKFLKVINTVNNQINLYNLRIHIQRACTRTQKCDVIKQHCASSFAEWVTALIRLLPFLQPMRICPRCICFVSLIIQQNTTQAEGERESSQNYFISYLPSRWPEILFYFGPNNSKYTLQH